MQCMHISMYVCMFLMLLVPQTAMLRGSYKIGLSSKGRQELGAGRLVLWVLPGPGVCFGVFGGLFVLVVV